MRAGLVLPAAALALWAHLPLIALPTPQLTEAEMTKAADVVVEGRVLGVTLAKRWVGDRAGVDLGYEQGDFHGWLLVTAAEKGSVAANQTLLYSVHAYAEGRWDDLPPRRLVYQGTQEAVTPGSLLRLYLKWDDQKRSYVRVHFNSGVTVLQAAPGPFPTTVGVPLFAPPPTGPGPEAAR